MYWIPFVLSKHINISTLTPAFWLHALRDWSETGAGHGFAALLAVAGIVGIVWPAVLPRRRSQVHSVEAWKDGLLLGASGSSRWEQIPGEDIAGVRVAEAAEGASLMVVRRNGAAIFLEFEDLEQSRSIAATLLESGLGTGDVALPARVDGTSSDVVRDRIEGFIRVSGLLFWVLCFACWNLSGDPFSPFWVAASNCYWRGLPWPLALVGILCVLAGFVFRCLRFRGHERLVLGKDELRLEDVRIPYVDIASVALQRGGIAIQLREAPADRSPIVIGLPGRSATELAHVATHILSAAEGAAVKRGEGSAASERLHDLSRRHDEPVRAWLSRLDALDTDPSAAPYRHTAIERVDLASIIGDIEAPVALRVAATRVLRRIDPEDTQRRIHEVEARAEPEVAHRLRIIVEEDIDDASEAYEALPPLFRAPVRRG
ncbi:hypothetical protein [Polyangium sp. 15x6]|uniref:hypothetical protein n=1 Tax=Polyangium sp. 15x6 TaxID=3042687 RepID=UPI00249C7AF6|nr:hypothetical protein [Polyangium sp. 15x6]MDI3288659.1 hypothetical protein [Polyangium sp. 15x6]